MKPVQKIGKVARFKGIGLGALAMLAAFAAAGAPATAAALSLKDPFAGLTPMVSAELQSHRGGFSVNTPVGTMDFDIGVTVTTKVETPVNSIELQTTVEFNNQGQVSSARSQQRQSSGAPSAAVSGSGNAFQLDLADSGAVVVHRIANDHVTLATSLTGSGMTIVQSAVMDISINDLSQIRSMQRRLAISRIGRTVGAMSVR